MGGGPGPPADPRHQLSVLLSLLTGYVAYVPADEVGASGVLAAVTAGIYMGIRGPGILPVRSRLQGNFVWDLVDFLLNASLFVLIGLQLRTVVEALSDYSPGTLVGYALAVAGVVVAARLVWFFTVPYLVWAVDRRSAPQAHGADARERLVVAWSGMRGAVSLAVALALPVSTDAGGFPQRDLIIFLTFAVILVTLVGQGLSLPTLIRRLGVSDGGADTDEEIRARLVATKAAIRQVDALAGEEWVRQDSVERLRGFYEFRKARFAARAGKIEDRGYEDRSQAYQQMLALVLAAQREALLRMRSRGELSNETMNRLLRELDLEESRLET